MYAASIYNYYKKRENSLIVYNSMTESLVFIHSNLDADEENMLKIFYSSNIKTREQLLDWRLIVDKNDNESQIAQVKYLDKMVNQDLYLMLLPTYECNFRCSYCYEHDTNSANSFSKSHMTLDVQNSIVDYVKSKLKDFHCLVVEWHGGEPLMQMDIINNLSKQFIFLAQRIGKPYVATLTTNGYALTKNTVIQLLQNHVIKFHVTLDGFGWNHDSYRFKTDGSPTFDIILHNLLEIKSIKQRNFTVILRTNITRKFLPFLDEWLLFLSQNFSDDSRFKIYIKMVEDKGGTNIATLANDLMNTEEEIYKVIELSPYKNNYSYYFTALSNSICSAGMRNKRIIAPNGVVKKCGHYLFDPRTNIGIMTKQGIQHDRNAFANWIRGTPIQGEKCEHCKLWACCFNTYCPLKTHFNENSENLSICSGEHQNIDKVLEILLSEANTDKSFVKHLHL